MALRARLGSDYADSPTAEVLGTALGAAVAFLERIGVLEKQPPRDVWHALCLPEEVGLDAVQLSGEAFRQGWEHMWQLRADDVHSRGAQSFYSTCSVGSITMNYYSLVCPLPY